MARFLDSSAFFKDSSSVSCRFFVSQSSYICTSLLNKDYCKVVRSEDWFCDQDNFSASKLRARLFDQASPNQPRRRYIPYFSSACALTSYAFAESSELKSQRPPGHAIQTQPHHEKGNPEILLRTRMYTKFPFKN